MELNVITRKHITEIENKTAENIDFTTLCEDKYHEDIANAARKLCEMYRELRREGCTDIPDYRTFTYGGQYYSGTTWWVNPKTGNTLTVNKFGDVWS